MNKVSLCTVATVSAGQCAPSPHDFSKTGKPFVRAGSLEDLLSGKKETDLELISEDTAKKLGLKLYPKGSILIAKSGMSATKNRVYVLRTPAYVVSHLAVLIPNGKINADYLRLVLKTLPLSVLIKDQAYPAIGIGEIQKYKIPVPEEIDDQARIAKLLCKAEGLVAKRKQHLQQLDELLRSVFLTMFGDPITNFKGYSVRRLSEFYISHKDGTKCGPFGSALKKNELVKSGVPVWNMDNIDLSGRMALPFRMWITKEKHQELLAYSVIDGDILISRAGTVGKMCVAQMNGEPAIISTNLIRLRLGPALLPLYFVSLMTYCKGRVGRLKTGPDGAFTHMNTGVLDNLEFPYPPPDLQRKFVAIAAKVDGLKSRYQSSLNDLKNLYGVLSQKAFKGELDLSRIVRPAGHDETADDIANAEPTAVATEMAKQIELSTPNISLIKVLDTPERRKSTIERWWSEYLAQLDSTSPFSAETFMNAAQHKLWELNQDGLFEPEDESALELGVAEYDQLTNWLFEELKHGRLKQVFDDKNNRVRILVAQG